MSKKIIVFVLLFSIFLINVVGIVRSEEIPQDEYVVTQVRKEVTDEGDLILRYHFSSDHLKDREIKSIKISLQISPKTDPSSMRVKIYHPDRDSKSKVIEDSIYNKTIIFSDDSEDLTDYISKKKETTTLIGYEVEFKITVKSIDSSVREVSLDSEKLTITTKEVKPIPIDTVIAVFVGIVVFLGFMGVLIICVLSNDSSKKTKRLPKPITPFKPLISEEEIIEIAQKIEVKTIICELCGTTNNIDKVVTFSTEKQKCKNCKSNLEVN